MLNKSPLGKRESGRLRRNVFKTPQTACKSFHLSDVTSIVVIS